MPHDGSVSQRLILSRASGVDCVHGLASLHVASGKQHDDPDNSFTAIAALSPS